MRSERIAAPRPDLQSARLTARSARALAGMALVLSLHGAALATAPATAGPMASHVAWIPAAADADIERAFAKGRAEKKPLLVYWGAKWCPPCNQLKATLFNRQDFIERSKSFVAVNIDGDLPGAQKLGTRFKVRGYPTMILFSPEGAEITRLPGEADAPQVMQVLQMGLAGGRPMKDALADARTGKPVTPNEWRMLAFYSWDTDEAQLVAAAERPALLAQLATACPASLPDVRMRLMLKSLAGKEPGAGAPPDSTQRDQVVRLLADAAATRSQMDVLVNYGPDLVQVIAPQPGKERVALAAAFDTALVRLQEDATLSRSDRLSALIARVSLLKLDQPKETLHPKLPEAVLKQVREEAARADREVTEPYERQAVITSAAYLLAEAGLWKDSDALLKASLAKSHSPYYLMSQLGGNARQQGRKAEALSWYARAFEKSEGPATRLQWGASYLSALVELAPQDSTTIEATASRLIAEAAGQQGAFYERSARSMQKVGAKLVSWNAGGKHQAALNRLRAQLAPVCGKLPAGDPQRATCDGMIKA